MAVRVQWKFNTSWVESAIFATEDEAERATETRPPHAEYRIVPHLDDELPDGTAFIGSVRWFGEAWPFPHLPAPICEDYRLRIPVPVGHRCMDCDEPILEDESGTRMQMIGFPGRPYGYQHAECSLRSVMCPITMGLVPDESGQHIHDPDKRREEGRLLLEVARKRARL